MPLGFRNGSYSYHGQLQRQTLTSDPVPNERGRGLQQRIGEEIDGGRGINGGGRFSKATAGVATLTRRAQSRLGHWSALPLLSRRGGATSSSRTSGKGPANLVFKEMRQDESGPRI
eukprot:549634-Pyramimonas_sp.AAC.1